jgi:hypothetical protein
VAARSSVGRAQHGLRERVGAAAYTLLLRRLNAAGWRWPADLRRPAADVGCGVVGSGPEVRIAIHRGCVSSMARGGFAGSSSRLEDVRVFGPGMVAVGQAGCVGFFIPLSAPAARRGGIVAGENRADSGHGGRRRRLRRYLLKASSSNYR